MKKYSKGFERDFNFYLDNIKSFNFCGTLNPKFEAIYSKNGLSAKEVFYSIQSEGKNKPCYEPALLNDLLLCQSSVNFQIKQWAEGRADSTLPLAELSKKRAQIKYPDDFSKFSTLFWVNSEPVYFEDIQTQYSLPDWVIDAVENQKVKFYKKNQTT